MKFRKLRIAWSTVCGIACVLLILLWVRSYWWADLLKGPLPGAKGVLADSTEGWVTVRWVRLRRDLSVWQMKHHSITLRNEQERKNIAAGAIVTPLPRNFGLHSNPGRLQLPYWFIVLLFMSSGCLPWISRARHFSLRTLLIVMAVVAVVLGFAVYTTRN